MYNIVNANNCGNKPIRESVCCISLTFGRKFE